MIQDPYEVLGVSRDASMDEIKKQYRILSRKYHPDANLNNPNKEEIAEKFRQVQEAYQMIVDEREHGTSGSSGQNRNYGGGYGGFGNFGDFNYENPESGGFGPSMNEPRMRAAVNYIKNGYFQEALNTLADIENHDGNWYYLHAVAQAGLGNNVGARQDAEQALHMEPDNEKFRQLYNQLNGNVEWYQDTGRGYGYEPCGSGSGNCAPWACCLGLVLCNCLCFPYGGVICC